MIKVNILTLDAIREALPASLAGLNSDTLQNLQTALDPVPFEHANMEYWPEIDATPPHDSTLFYMGDEAFTVNENDKTVSVERAIVSRPVADIANDIEAALKVEADARENTVITYGGMSLSTTDTTINRAHNATKNLGKNPTRTVEYNTGFNRVVLTVTAAQIEGLHGVLMDYRESVADNEAALIQAIVAAEVLGDTQAGRDAMAAIDTSAGWPPKAIS